MLGIIEFYYCIFMFYGWYVGFCFILYDWKLIMGIVIVICLLFSLFRWCGIFRFLGSFGRFMFIEMRGKKKINWERFVVVN